MATIDATTPQLGFLKSYVKAYETLNIHNVEPLYSKNLKIETLPKTAELPDISRDEYLQKNGQLLAGLSKTEITIHDVTEAPGKLVFHGTAVCTTPDGGKHIYEKICTLKLVEEEGQIKITEVKDFIDPTSRDQFENGITQALKV